MPYKHSNDDPLAGMITLNGTVIGSLTTVNDWGLDTNDLTIVPDIPRCSGRYPWKKTEPLSIKRVIFHDPATVIYWSDGTKTVVKCKNEKFDKEKGLAMACMKKLLGNKGHYYEEVKKWAKEETNND